VKRALLVVDAQNEYFFGKLPVSYPPGGLNNILRAMDTAAKNRIPVVVIQHTATSDASPVFRRDSPEWQLYPDIENRHRDVLIEKNWPDSFHETILEQWLRSNEIDTLTVCGYMTQLCCDTTARRAFHLGYAVEFLSDATGTLAFKSEAGTVADEELHRAILVTQSRHFSKVMKTDEWVSHLRSELTMRTPNKALQPTPKSGAAEL
jgi:nicotinamidase-related amidase